MSAKLLIKFLIFFSLSSVGFSAFAGFIFEGKQLRLVFTGSADDFVDVYEGQAKRRRDVFYSNIVDERPVGFVPMNYEIQYPPGLSRGTFDFDVRFSFPKSEYFGSALNRATQFEMEMAKKRIEVMSILNIHAAYSQHELLPTMQVSRGAVYPIISFPELRFNAVLSGYDEDIIQQVDHILEAYRRSFEIYVKRPETFAPLEKGVVGPRNRGRLRPTPYTFNNSSYINFRQYYGSDLTKMIAFEADIMEYRRAILRDFEIISVVSPPKTLSEAQQSLMATIREGDRSKIDDLSRTEFALNISNGTLRKPRASFDSVLTRVDSCKAQYPPELIKYHLNPEQASLSFADCIVGGEVVSDATKIGAHIKSAKKSYECLSRAIDTLERSECLSNDFGLDAAKGRVVAECLRDSDPVGCANRKLLTPNENTVLADINCFAGAASEQDKLDCLTDNLDGQQAEAAKITQCLSNAKSDKEKVLCTVEGRLGKNEAKALEVANCMLDSDSNLERINCAAEGSLGKNEQEALRVANCAASSTSYIGTAACASGVDLTDEQQVYVDCASSASAGPKAYGACVAGKLTAKELQKCLDSGFGGEGCFGKNNFFRQNIENVRREMCNAVGNTSDACGALTYIVDNTLMPGQGHEAVKYFNQGLSDIRNGPGKNNDFVKASKNAERFLQDAQGDTDEALKNVATETRKAEENIRKTADKAKKDIQRKTTQALKEANDAANRAFNEAANVSGNVLREGGRLAQNVGNEFRAAEQNTRREVQNGLDGVNKALGIGGGGIRW